MEKIMVIVFADEAKAYEGVKALKQLDHDGSIAVHQGVLLRKNKDGAVQLDESALAEFPIQTLAGTAVGGLIGVLGGPAGIAAGLALGGLTGLVGDSVLGTLDGDFIEEVSTSLTPTSAAVVLDVSEEWITPVDTELSKLSKTIVRRPRVDVEDELLARRADANDKELKSMEQELSRATAEQKEKIQKRIDKTKVRQRQQVARLEARKTQTQSENRTKVDALRKKISAAATEAKAKIQARIDALQKADQDFTQRVDKAVAGRLRGAADDVERKSA
jgi:uncharacterized membrane protein